MAQILVNYGIKAIWNFAHLDLELPKDVIVQNVHLSESLMTLSYNLSEYRKNVGSSKEHLPQEDEDKLPVDNGKEALAFENE